MKIRLVSILFTVVCGCSAALASDPPAKGNTTAAKPAEEASAGGKLPAPEVQCEAGAAKQQCCSAKNCGGKVLSNRDQHNCKTKSTGKSWHAANSTTCVNL